MLWGGAAYATPSDEEELALVYGDKANISIATGNSQSTRRAPSSATVITANDIADMGATNLDTVLETVPGLHISYSSSGLNSIYSFRGIATSHNPQVLMLVNGIPITNVFWGDRSLIWGGMPLENVARIEVIRGPGSAVYGADAFSGVINVITKTAADINGTEFGFGAGSFNSRAAWIQHGGKLGELDASFYLRASNSDGQNGIIRQDAQSVLDTIFGTRASLAPGPVNAQNKSVDMRAELAKDEWHMRAGYQQRELGTGAGVAGALDPLARAHSSRLYLDASYDKVNCLPNWDVSAVLGYYNIKDKPGNPAYTLFPAGSVLPSGAFPNGMIGNPGHAEQHTHGSVSAFYTGFADHRVRVGTGFRVEDLYATWEAKNYDANFAPLPGIVNATGNPALIYMLPHKRNLVYAFAQDEWSFAQDWTLTAGVRTDRYSDFGSTTNPRFALVWDAAYNVVVKAMHGSAFRAPSFAEQFSINNPVAVGTPNIQPETMSSDELAFSWKVSPDLETNLNFFQYRMRNIILPVAARYQNIGDQTGHGMEFDATYDVSSKLRIAGNIALQRSTDKTTGQDAGIAPHSRVFVRADWRVAPQWQLGTTLNHVAGRMREPGDVRPNVPDYTTVDMVLRHDNFANDWDVRAVVTNLFNRTAWDPTFKSVGMPSDLPLPGRAFYLMIQNTL